MSATSPAGRLERFAFAAILGLIATTLVYTQALWRWDQLIYDAQIAWWSRPAPEDIVIVAIDEASLSQLGRWPWSRDLHARVLERLTESGAKAIGLDIIFAEPNRDAPEGDQAFASALQDNGRTSLPVYVEPPRLGGQLIERLPIPDLASAARDLGHVHVELDPDGIARRVYLKEGLGDARWPTLALSMLAIAGEMPDKLPGLRNPAPHDRQTRAWVRDHLVLIPFAGPPGSFLRISYEQVLRGDFDRSLFKDKYVLVGMTAAGAGDALPTPVSGLDQFMPGVEFNANLLDALRRGITIQPIALKWQYLLSVVIALLPVLIYPRVPPKLSLVSAASVLIATVLVSLLLLRVGKIWFAPMAGLASLLLSYPLWSWWRLAATMRFLDQELGELRAEQAELSIAPPQPIHSSVTFLARVMEPEGWLLRERGSGETQGRGIDPGAPNPVMHTNEWRVAEDIFWTLQSDNGLQYDVGFQFSDARHSERYATLLDWFVNRNQSVPKPEISTGEIMQMRIDQVRIATEDLRTVREFVDDSISQMTTGIVVASRMGRVTLANPQATALLTGSDESMLGKSLPDLLDPLEITDALDPVSQIRQALLNNEHTAFNARNLSGRYLFIQLGPLAIQTSRGGGLIMNVSDVTELRESERRRAEVLGFLSHDIRSPLVSILALVELSETRSTPEELRNLLQRTQTYASKTLQLAEQLLELARAESLQPSSLTEFDFITSAVSAFEQTWSQAQAREMDIGFECELEAAWIHGDPELVERAIVNLIVNALKYSPRGTTIALRLSQVEGGYRLDVQDHGYGIEADEVAGLFERFRRGKSAASSEERGIGLGLAFVLTVAEKHGGRITVQSDPGAGSTFSLFFPSA